MDNCIKRRIYLQKLITRYNNDEIKIVTSSHRYDKLRLIKKHTNVNVLQS